MFTNAIEIWGTLHTWHFILPPPPLIHYSYASLFSFWKMLPINMLSYRIWAKHCKTALLVHCRVVDIQSTIWSYLMSLSQINLMIVSLYKNWGTVVPSVRQSTSLSQVRPNRINFSLFQNHSLQEKDTASHININIAQQQYSSAISYPSNYPACPENYKGSWDNLMTEQWIPTPFTDGHTR